MTLKNKLLIGAVALSLGAGNLKAQNKVDQSKKDTIGNFQKTDNYGAYDADKESMLYLTDMNRAYSDIQTPTPVKNTGSSIKNKKDTTQAVYDGDLATHGMEPIEEYIEEVAHDDAQHILDKGDVLGDRSHFNLDNYISYQGYVKIDQIDTLTQYIDSIVSKRSATLTPHQQTVYMKKITLIILDMLQNKAQHFEHNGLIGSTSPIYERDTKDEEEIKNYSRGDLKTIGEELDNTMTDAYNKIYRGSETRDTHHIAREIKHFYNRIYRIYQKTAEIKKLKTDKEEYIRAIIGLSTACALLLTWICTLLVSRRLSKQNTKKA